LLTLSIQQSGAAAAAHGHREAVPEEAAGDAGPGAERG